MKAWMGRVIEWSMQDPLFKTQLFRFIDVLPVLTRRYLRAKDIRYADQESAYLFSEYMSEAPGELPGFLKKWVGTSKTGAAFTGKALRKNIEALAHLFIAGAEPRRQKDEIIKTVHELYRKKRTFTLDLLGEAVLSLEEARGHRNRYLELIRDLPGMLPGMPPEHIYSLTDLPRVDLSLKISSFDPRLDPADFQGSIKSLHRFLGPLIEEAQSKGVAIHFDMEHSQLKDLTIAAFLSILEEHPGYDHAGIAIQAYHKSGLDDLNKVIHWAHKEGRRINIRLVKGAYWDYETAMAASRGWPSPLFSTKEETDANFEAMTKTLLEFSDVVRPEIASHNIRSISYALAYAEALGLKPVSYEFQMLHGMAEPLKEELVGRGYLVRDYLPVGEILPAMAYFVRRLLENTSNDSFLRLSYHKKSAKEPLALLARPRSAAEIAKASEALSKKDKTSAKSEKETSGDSSKPQKEREIGSFVNTPLLDFSLKENRIAFQEAIEPFCEEYFGGKVPKSLEPFTLEKVEKAIERARKAQSHWAAMSAHERTQILFRAADLLEKERFEAAALVVFDAGKSWREADADIAEAIDFLRYYSHEMIRLSGHHNPRPEGDLPGEENRIDYLPRGVAAVISPWNFPVAIAMGMSAAALAAGNTVLLKPSSLTIRSATILSKVLAKAGLPHGVFQVAPGSGDVIGRALVNHPGVDIVAFTGSREAGLDIIKRASVTQPGQKNIKKVVVEMGGKNAIIIDATADLDEAVSGALASVFGYQGQKCSAASRLILVKEVYEEFLERFCGACDTLRIGPPDLPGFDLGPVIDAKARKKIESYIRRGKKEAKVAFERTISAAEIKFRGLDPERYVGHVVFADVPVDAKIANEEIFGPVVCVMKAENLRHAVEIANSTPYALTGGLYSRSPENIEWIKKEFRVGNLYINRKISGALVGRQPFGGFGMSGTGTQAGGPDYIKNFLFARCTSENTIRRGFAPESEPGVSEIFPGE